MRQVTGMQQHRNSLGCRRKLNTRRLLTVHARRRSATRASRARSYTPQWSTCSAQAAFVDYWLAAATNCWAFRNTATGTRQSAMLSLRRSKQSTWFDGFHNQCSNQFTSPCLECGAAANGAASVWPRMFPREGKYWAWGAWGLVILWRASRTAQSMV